MTRIDGTVSIGSILVENKDRIESSYVHERATNSL